MTLHDRQRQGSRAHLAARMITPPTRPLLQRSLLQRSLVQCSLLHLSYANDHCFNCRCSNAQCSDAQCSNGRCFNRRCSTIAIPWSRTTMARVCGCGSCVTSIVFASFCPFLGRRLAWLKPQRSTRPSWSLHVWCLMSRDSALRVSCHKEKS